MKIKINYKNSAPKYVSSMVFGRIMLVDKEEATEFSGQYNALFYLGLISRYLTNENPELEIKSIEFLKGGDR